MNYTVFSAEKQENRHRKSSPDSATEQPAPSPSLKEVALDYAELGWSVLPLHSIRNGTSSCGKADCPSPGKHPRTAHGVKEATTNLKKIKAWWSEWPDANIGIATGLKSGLTSGLLVLDIDPRNGGMESLAELERDHGRLPETMTVLSGGGGKHLYFQRPAGKIGWNGRAMPGIDLKADGHYKLSEKPREHGRAWLQGEIGRAREKPDQGSTSSRRSTNGGGLNVRWLSDVEPENVEWLWQPYIPIGKVTSIEGDPGIGKSFMTAAIAGMVSLGRGAPCGTISSEPARVLMLSAEDGLAETLRPRLDALGANVQHVFASETPVTLDENGLKLVRAEIEKYRPKLVVIDPLVAFMGGKLDMNKANQVRELMAGLARIANETRTATITIRHLTKGSRERAIYRGQGSIDITAACRSVLMVGLHPEDEARCVVAHAKSNLAALGPSISYTIDKGDGRFQWGSTVNIRAEDLNRDNEGEKAPSMLDEAKEFLKALLADGPVAANRCTSEAEDAGIAGRTLKRAKKALGVRSCKLEDEWVWEPPQDCQDA